MTVKSPSLTAGSRWEILAQSLCKTQIRVSAPRNVEGLAEYYFIFEVHVMGVLKNSM